MSLVSSARPSVTRRSNAAVPTPVKADVANAQLSPDNLPVTQQPGSSSALYMCLTHVHVFSSATMPALVVIRAVKAVAPTNVHLAPSPAPSPAIITKNANASVATFMHHASSLVHGIARTKLALCLAAQFVHACLVMSFVANAWLVDTLALLVSCYLLC